MWNGETMLNKHTLSPARCPVLRFSPGRSCLGHGRKALFGRSYWPAYSLSSTCLSYSHTSGGEGKIRSSSEGWADLSWLHTFQTFRNPDLLSKTIQLQQPLVLPGSPRLLLTAWNWSYTYGLASSESPECARTVLNLGSCSMHISCGPVLLVHMTSSFLDRKCHPPTHTSSKAVRTQCKTELALGLWVSPLNE